MFLLLMLWIKPVDGLRKYDIYNHSGQADEFLLPVYGDKGISQYFKCAVTSDSFEIYASPVNKEYHGNFCVQLLDCDENVLEKWITDKLDTSEGWVQYRTKTCVLEPEKEYSINITAPELDEFGAIGIAAFDDVIGLQGVGEMIYSDPLSDPEQGVGEKVLSFGVYKRKVNVFAIFAYICLFGAVNICYVMRNKETHKIALPILIASGLIMFFILAPGCGPDDIYHYYSSITLSNKLLLRSNADEIEKRYETDLPIHHNTNSALVETYEGLRYRVGGEEGTFLYDGRKDKLRWPISHLAQAAGITIGRLLRLGFIRVYTLGRLFNLAAYIALAMLAVRLVPVNKELMLMMAILPMSMQQATQLSYDMPVNGLALVFTGYVFNILYNKTQFDWRKTIICALLLTAISPLKVIYILLGLLLLLIPGTQFGSVRDRIIKLGTAVLCSVIALAAARSSDVSASAVRNAQAVIPDSGIREAGHYTIRFVFSEPVRFIRLILSNWGAHLSNMFKGMIGSSLAGFSISIPEHLVMLFALCIVLCALADRESPISNRWQMIIILILPVIGYLAVLTVFTFAETTYGLTYIGGVQGRYLIPFMFPAMYCLCGRRINISINRLSLFIPIAFVEIGYIAEVMNNIDF